MDYINAIGIALFALFGLWAFQKGAEARKGGQSRRDRSGARKDEEE